MHRNNSKRKIVIYSLLGVLLLMTVGYASFQSSLKIKGTSKVSSNWDIEITNVTSGTSTGSAENGKDENGNVILPSWDKLSTNISSDLYESGDSMTYIVTIENKGTIDAELSDIIPRYSNPNQNYSNNDAIIINFSGFTKGQKLYKAGHSGSTIDITVTVSYNENYSGGPVSGEASIEFNFTQAKTEDINNGDIDTENKYLVTYNCIENGGTDCTGNNEYYYVGEQIDLSNNIGDVTTNGYTLIGWNTNKEAEEGLENYEMPNEDKVLYAIYSKTLNVTYQKEEGVSSVSKEKDTCTMYNLNTKCEIILPTITVEDKGYYKADGWYKENEKIGSSKDKINISEDTVLTSKVIAIPIMMSGPNFQTAIDSYKSSITSVEFLDDIDIPDGAISIDVSEKQNKSVMAWLVDDGNNGYKLYIGGKDGVIANEDCSTLFHSFTSAASIEFNDNFDTSNVTNMFSMFRNSTSLIMLDLSSFNTSKVEDMSYMFVGSVEYTTSWGTQTNMMLSEIKGLTNFDTSKVKSMHSMFANCGELKELDLSNFDTSNVTSMAEMFNGPNTYDSKLQKIKFGQKWNTSNVTTMSYMFCDSISLTEIDLSVFDTRNITNMTTMFGNCPNLKTIYVSEKFVTTSVTSSSSMFTKDTNLVGGNGTTYDSTKIDKTYALIDKEGQKGYFTLGSSNGIDLSISTSAKTESITVVSNALSSNAINKYEYSIDNGETWIESNDTHTFNNLKENTKYNVMAKVTDSSGSTKEVSKTVFTPALTSPTYDEADISGSKRVRIIYPEGCESVYTCTYSKNGNDYITVNDISEYVYFSEEGNVIAKITDGTNEVSSSYNVIYDNLIDYSGKEVTFVVPETGKYKLEIWGAQGGTYTSEMHGGYGGYSVGNIELEKSQNLYVVIGGSGKKQKDGETSVEGGYNGGGSVTLSDSYSSSGGGATHIALSTGLLTTFENNQSDLLIVAGAGGGAAKYGSRAGVTTNGGNGGGFKGNSTINYTSRLSNNYNIINGGGQQLDTQSEVLSWQDRNNNIGSFGQGGNTMGESSYSSAGGGGYYGGSGGFGVYLGAGGSGYIGNTSLTDKYMACYDCQTSSEYSTKTITVNCHSERPLANCAKEGNGYVKITKVSDISTPTFVDISGDIEIQYPEGCNNKYTCTYSKNGGEYVTVTSNPTITFDEDGYIVAKVTDGDEIVSSSYKFIKDKIYVKSDGNDTTGFGTVNSPYATLTKAYNQATSAKEATIYVMDDITQTETFTMDSDKDIILTSCTKDGTGCSYDSNNSIIRDNNLTSYVIYEPLGKLTIKKLSIDGNNVEASDSMIGAHKGVIEDSTIIKNAVSNSSAGAALRSIGNGSLIINGGEISNNESNGYGGGIYVNESSTLIIKRGFISNNHAVRGGGLYIKGILIMEGGTISDNLASLYGGGIRMDGFAIINSGTISNNIASSTGGAINTNGSSTILTINGGTIKENNAGTSGGAIDSNTTVNITGGTIQNNIGSTTGGAIYSKNILNISGGQITNNTSQNGSGIYSSTNGTLTVSGTPTINSNTNTSTTYPENITNDGTFIDNRSSLTITNTNYYVLPYTYTTVALDVAGGKAANSTNVQLYTKASSNRMKWKVYPRKVVSGTVYYGLASAVGSSQYLNVNGNSTTTGANVNTYTVANANGRFWSFEKTGSYYNIKNIGGLCLHTSAFTSGTSVTANTCGTSNNQKWKLSTS